MGSESHRIRVVFKSGYVQDFECSEFKVEKMGDKVQSLTWKDIRPRIMQIDLEQIAAVLELHE